MQMPHTAKGFDLAKYAEQVVMGPALPAITPRLCAGGCGATVDRFDLCPSCYREIKGPFELERDDGSDE
jgi:hypothetical protein